MHSHDRARCLGSFGRELLGRYLRAPGALYNFDPFVRRNFRKPGRASLQSTRKSIRRSENNDRWRDLMIARDWIRDPAEGRRTKRCRVTRVAICGAPRLRSRRERRVNEYGRRGVSCDNALIKCHESAPLCASAAWIYKYAWRRPSFASPMNILGFQWQPLIRRSVEDSTICCDFVRVETPFNRLTLKPFRFIYMYMFVRILMKL